MEKYARMESGRTMSDEFEFEKLNKIAQYFVYGIVGLIAIFDLYFLMTGKGNLIGIIALIILEAVVFSIEFFISVDCWEWAYERKLNTNIAFIWGLCTGPGGMFLYWIYTRFFPAKMDEDDITVS